jgi:hypothetical protein
MLLVFAGCAVLASKDCEVEHADITNKHRKDKPTNRSRLTLPTALYGSPDGTRI